MTEAYFSPSDELGFLGACMLGNIDTASEAVAQVSPSMLINEDIRDTLEVIAVLARDNKSASIENLTRAWRQTKGSVGLPTSVWMEAMQACPTEANLPYYITGIREAHHRRKLRDAASKLLADTASASVPLDQALANLEAGITLEQDQTPNSTTAKDVVNAFVSATEERWKRKGQLSGITSGIPKLDSLTDGIQVGEMTLIAARPSIGKTAMAVSVAKAACIEANVPTLFVSCEMSEQALMRRLVSAVANVPMQAIKTGELSDIHMSRMSQAIKLISSKPLHFLDLSANAKIGTIIAAIRRASRKHGVRLVILDYLQKVRASGKHEKRTYEVAEVSGALKACAVATNTAMLCLAQLNRESEKEKGRKPRLSDLADSGQIERDADTVLLLDRERTEAKGEATLAIAKQRDGECGFVTMWYEGAYCRFEPALLQDS
jgi:replicative DNA helicase